MIGKIIILAILVRVFIWQLGNDAEVKPPRPDRVRIGNVIIRPDVVGYTLTSTDGNALNLETLGFFTEGNSTDSRECFSLNAGVCWEWQKKMRLEISRERLAGNDECYHVTWLPLNRGLTPTDCFSLHGSFWYGGPSAFRQEWPSDKQVMQMWPYFSFDVLGTSHDAPGSVLERYWISSSGFGIHVHHEVPLHVSINSMTGRKLCLKADNLNYTFGEFHTNKKDPILRYTICKSNQNNVKDIHQIMSKMFLGKPSGMPDKRMFKSPVWSTWARYKISVDEEKVLAYAEEINENKFPNSQIEIDDIYTPTYGEVDFDKEKFPNPKNMSDTLHRMGFKITTWVHPFINVESPLFLEGVRNGYFVRGIGGDIPSLVRWWQGIAGAIDFTNPAAAAWYRDNLQTFQKMYGIDSFKFDAGEVQYLPRYFQTKNGIINPGEYTVKYAELVSSFGGLVEMRASYQSQRHPIFVRMFDKDSRWGYDNGLKTMIPTALLMGILGYPFILPDMIGGNAYSEQNFASTSFNLPDRELYIRWAQLTAYLPAMQFSIAPWQYDDDITSIAREMVKVHEEFVAPILLEAAKQSVKDGTPIIRPLWWIDPRDEEALKCDSEFLVGDNLLVAPILEPGARKRDVYLPTGVWRDHLRGTEHRGRVWLRNYNIDITEIGTFTRKH